MALPAESTASDFRGLFTLYMAIAIAVAVLVLAAIAYAAIRYRDREDMSPRQVRGLKQLEGVWVALVTATVVALLVSTFRTEDRVDAVAGDPQYSVRVVAFQWGWRFSYPGSGVTVTGNTQRPPMLAVPSGVPVRFEITSRDVIHSFWVPALRFKRDAFPDRVSEFDLTVEPGVSTTGRCAEFCGLGHDGMEFELVSMERGDFDRWLKGRERRARSASGGPE